MIDCIVSLTSHTKSRLEQLPKFLFNSLLKFNKTNFKVVLTLYKDDVQFITEDLQTLIDNDLVELIIAEENLRSHLKYFYVMQKYRDLPIITIDDDMIYPVQMFDYMLEEYHKNPSVILCRSCQQFTYTNGNINDTRKWLWNPANNIAHINHAEGYAGILYPPNCLHITEDLIPEIYDTIMSDDIYLSILEIRNRVKVYYLPKMRHEFVLATKGDQSISLTPNIVETNNSYVNKFKDVFNLANTL